MAQMALHCHHVAHCLPLSLGRELQEVKQEFLSFLKVCDVLLGHHGAHLVEEVDQVDLKNHHHAQGLAHQSYTDVSLLKQPGRDVTETEGDRMFTYLMRSRGDARWISYRPVAAWLDASRLPSDIPYLASLSLLTVVD